MFCFEIEKKEEKIVEFIFIVVNEILIVKLFSIFWFSCGNFIYLIECFYDIVRKREINFDY